MAGFHGRLSFVRVEAFTEPGQSRVTRKIYLEGYIEVFL